MIRVLVCGGRWWDDQFRVDQVLDLVHARTPISVLIQGGQRTRRRHYTLGALAKITTFGADYQAKVWAESRGVTVIEEKAKWDVYGPKAAGGIRNSKMLRDHKPDFGIAFKGGPGTADMVGKMRAAGIFVWEFDHT